MSDEPRTEPTPAELEATYSWALRVVRFTDNGQMPGVTSIVEDPWIPPRSGWGNGAWMAEPDLVEWRSTAAPGYPLLILRGGMGALCGYVGVPPEHPLHGKGSFYGTNWSGPCGWLRVPTGMAPACWWFGFDCGHAHEYSPLLEAGMQFMGDLAGVPYPQDLREKTYVTVDECRIRTEALAVLLKAVDTREKLVEAFGRDDLPGPE